MTQSEEKYLKRIIQESVKESIVTEGKFGKLMAGLGLGAALMGCNPNNPNNDNAFFQNVDKDEVVQKYDQNSYLEMCKKKFPDWKELDPGYGYCAWHAGANKSRCNTDKNGNSFINTLLLLSDNSYVWVKVPFEEIEKNPSFFMEPIYYLDYEQTGCGNCTTTTCMNEGSIKQEYLKQSLMLAGPIAQNNTEEFAKVFNNFDDNTKIELYKYFNGRVADKFIQIMKSNMGLTESKIANNKNSIKEDYFPYIKSLCNFMVKNGYTASPLPKIVLDNSKQDGVFIRTGYFDPESQHICLFVNGRHMKDVLRSLAHELIHHKQRVDGVIEKSGYNGDKITEDKNLVKLEEDAYLNGNMAFRSWTETEQKKNELNESSIHIKKKNEGKFNKTKERTGKSTEELTHSKNPLTRKRAIFAQNAKKWNHKK